MSLQIRAEFALGYYQGRDAKGVPERWPTPLRLFRALVDAGHSLGDGTTLTPEIEAALAWLEGNPPSRALLPPSRLSDPAPRAYRDKGLIHKGAGGAPNPTKKSPEPARRISALADAVTFYWDEEPDEEIAQALDRLCGEVAYLGERDSVVSLSAGNATAVPADAHHLDVNRFGSTHSSTPMGYALPGHLRALEHEHASRYPAKAPSPAADRPTTSETEVSAANVTEAVATVRYRRPEPSAGDGPWNRAFLVDAWWDGGGTATPRPWDPADDELVRWATVLHRALVKNIGWDVPPIVTGTFLEGQPRPANNIAIHVLRPGWPIAEHTAETPAFLVLLPKEATPEEAARVADALRATTALYAGRHGRLRLAQVREVSPDTLWNSPGAGLERWWRPTPVMVSETRPQSHGAVSDAWTTADAVRVATAFVWRDDPMIGAHGGKGRYIAMSRAAHDAGVEVAEARRAPLATISDYVHRTNGRAMPVAIRGWIRLGDLASPTQAIAIGQSRHLGGGLLLPVDVPAGTFGRGESDA